MGDIIFGDFGPEIWYPGDGAVEPEQDKAIEEKEMDNVDQFEPVELDMPINPDEDFVPF